MKMICPHCGVKGSADDSLLDKTVKCPKCLGMFVVNTGVLEPISVDEFDLEPVEETSPQLETTPDREVDDIFNKLLATDSATVPGQEYDEGEIDKILVGEMGEDELVEGEAVALSSPDEDPASGWLGEEEDEDNTLTVIDDFPDEAISQEEMSGEEESIVLEDTDDFDDTEDEPHIGGGDDLAYESDKFDWDNMDDDSSALAEVEESEDQEDTLTFDDEVADDQEDTLKFDDELADDQENTLEFEDGIDDDQEDTLKFDDEITDDQEIALEFDEEIADKKEDEDFPPDEDESEEVEEDDILEWGENLEDGEEGPSFFDDVDDDDLDTEEELELTVDEAEAELKEGNIDDEVPSEEPEDETEEKPEVIQKCSACGEYVDQNAKYKLGTNVYCDKCVPRRDKSSSSTSEMAAAGAAVAAAAAAATAAASAPGKFTVTTLIKDAYHYSKGAKGSIWGAVIVMYIILFGLGAGSVFLLPQAMDPADPTTAALAEGGLQIFTSLLSAVMTAGILLIAIRKIGNQQYSWKMVFSGFKKFGSLLLLFILESIMVTIGFLLLILPGIYLSVGYILAIPLVMAKGMSPWQALETSRKAVHKRWWTVFFSLIGMSILMTISAIPMGLGLIWTVPMFVVLIGVLYYHFFGDTE